MTPYEHVEVTCLAETLLGKLGRYLAAGRRYVTLPDEFLLQEWGIAVRALVDHPDESVGSKILLNCQCELFLRGIQAPRELPRNGTDRLYELLDQLLRRDEPDPELSEQLRARVTALKARLESSKHQ
jgi:hypothetical protein